MMRKLAKRLQEVAQVFCNRPIPTKVTKEAFARFRATGALPSDYREAKAVIDRVRSGYFIVDDDRGRVDWGGTMQAALAAVPRPKDDFMDCLLNEALNATGPVQLAARCALCKCARDGLDPSQALFAGRPLPEFGTVGFELLEYHRLLEVPPYVRQCRRLYKRLDALRRQLPQRDEYWTDRKHDALDRFQHAGECPEDPLLLELVLVVGEHVALGKHAAGEDARAELALFDAAARGEGAEREDAIRALQAMAAAGRFSARDEEP
jgi:hypothetical protein